MINKPLRQTMPLVATFVDDLRAAFGAEVINTSIKRGMAGEPGFFAAEHGATVGTRFPAGGGFVSADKMNLKKIDPKTCGCPACKAARLANHTTLRRAGFAWGLGK